MQELRRYSRWIHYGERRLVLFDEHFSTGDLDGATDALKNAWRALLMPLTFLTGCFEGAFWEDWPHRRTVEDNISRAQDLLLSATADDVEEVMCELKVIMGSNFVYLRRALRLLCADMGPKAVFPSR